METLYKNQTCRSLKSKENSSLIIIDGKYNSKALSGSKRANLCRRNATASQCRAAYFLFDR